MRWWIVFLVPAFIMGQAYFAQTRPHDLRKIPELASAPFSTCVQRAYPGRVDAEGNVRQVSPIFGAPLITLLLRNPDRWLIDQAYANPALLGRKLTIEDLIYYDAANRTAESHAAQAETPRYQDVRRRFNDWYRGLKSMLRFTISGHQFATLTPYDPTERPKAIGEDTWDSVTFRIAPGPSEKGRWDETVRSLGVRSRAKISVSLPDGLDMPTEVNGSGYSSQDYEFEPISPMRQKFALAGTCLVALFLWVLASSTNILRLSADSDESRKIARPWSLARVTMAWWLILCAGAYLFLWAVTGNYNSLSGSVPLLLGINGGTLAISAFAVREEQKGNSNARKTRRSQGFVTDLISEGSEAEISRVQMIAWNFLLGGVFAVQTWQNWEMPEFDPTVMALLGISSSAYVGFKFAEKKSPEGIQS